MKERGLFGEPLVQRICICERRAGVDEEEVDRPRSEVCEPVSSLEFTPQFQVTAHCGGGRRKTVRA